MYMYLLTEARWIRENSLSGFSTLCNYNTAASGGTYSFPVNKSTVIADHIDVRYRNLIARTHTINL